MTSFFKTAFAITAATLVSIAGLVVAMTSRADSPASQAATISAAPVIRPISKTDLKAITRLNEKYRTSPAISMQVEKNLKLGLLGQERKSSGKLYLAGGQLRMELEGSEKTLLVVNKKNIFAVTYPAPQLKGAAVQVIRGDISSKKAQTQSITGLLGAGGFLKNFKPTGAQTGEAAETVYFLQPNDEKSEFKRAQLRVSKDGKQILELRYWDERDNETSYVFSETVFGKKADNKLFQYTPPADADVMQL